jgi:hypothetical protein
MGRRQSCCIEDEGRPLEIGLWDQVSNPAKLRGLRGWVVSVGETSGNDRAGRSEEDERERTAEDLS